MMNLIADKCVEISKLSVVPLFIKQIIYVAGSIYLLFGLLKLCINHTSVMRQFLC